MYKKISTFLFLIFFICTHALAETVYNPEASTNEKKAELNWFNLRIPENEYNSNLQDQRIFKLKAHKHMANATLLLATGTFVSAILAKKEIDKNRAARQGLSHRDDAKELNLHMALAGATLISYYTTAYFSITAPKSESMIDTENVKWHKRFSYIHFPGMIMAPILGVMAYQDYKNAKNPSGIAKLHRPIMSLTSLALLGAVISINF